MNPNRVSQRVHSNDDDDVDDDEDEDDDDDDADGDDDGVLMMMMMMKMMLVMRMIKMMVPMMMIMILMMTMTTVNYQLSQGQVRPRLSQYSEPYIQNVELTRNVLRRCYGIAERDCSADNGSAIDSSQALSTFSLIPPDTQRPMERSCSCRS
jgi:hypothetical protein